MKKYYTTGEVAKIVGISEKTAKNYCTSGKILSEKTPITNYRRISYENLEKFLVENGLSVTLIKHKKPIKVLVVDDEPEIIELLQIGLKEITENIVIETASDGYDACIKAGVLIPDLILLDLNMPKADGFEVFRSIRNHAETRHIKVIVITAYYTEENIARLEEYKPIAIYMKPFKLYELMGKIKLLFEGAKKH